MTHHRRRPAEGATRCTRNTSPSVATEDVMRCTPRVTGHGEPVTIASAERIGKDQTAGSAHPDHELVTRYAQNRNSVDWAIFMDKIIMAQPSPLSALSSGQESWWRRSGRMRFECKRLGQGKSSAAVMSVRS